jgi:hypothetical protein
MNDPRRALTRLDLQNALHAAGINTFRVHVYRPDMPHPQFPVFLRWEKGHGGSISPLAHSADELHRLAREVLRTTGHRAGRLLAMEFCDTCGADGIYRKYAVMRVGEHLVPRHVFFSREWMQKTGDLFDPDQVAEEAAFVAACPHRDAVLAAFDRAHITYGRMDYGVLDGRIQVWEINTNPGLVPPREAIAPERLASQSASADRIAAALEMVDTAHASAGRPFAPLGLSHQPLAWAWRLREAVRQPSG